MSDLTGYSFPVESGRAVVKGTWEHNPAYVLIEITDDKGMVSESLRVEAQVRRRKQIEDNERAAAMVQQPDYIPWA